MPATVGYLDLLQSARREPPRWALVLGSGLGRLAERLDEPIAVPFADVPGFAESSVAGHGGRVVLGWWGAWRVVVFQGRLHRYEGHPWETVFQPVRLARTLGASRVLLTNAAGGIHEALSPGRLMAIRDHIDWTRPYSGRRPAAQAGEGSPPPYAPRLLALLQASAEEIGLPLFVGVYAQLTGPSYETPAEIRALRVWGADAVGMSTAREAEEAVRLGLECGAISLITNRAAGLADRPLSHEEVLLTAQETADRLQRLIELTLRDDHLPGRAS
ncbi:MAG: purine-nucleoside phosphorylase [Gemmataceae bacterium]|nr:purine-nucleoside phosphorylase [Gemmataceae bacterium]MDW8263911.1 purine-nucleoside phosphorylase [Gemmataceae bacterium]